MQVEGGHDFGVAGGHMFGMQGQNLLGFLRVYLAVVQGYGDHLIDHPALGRGQQAALVQLYVVQLVYGRQWHVVAAVQVADVVRQVGGAGVCFQQGDL